MAPLLVVIKKINETNPNTKNKINEIVVSAIINNPKILLLDEPTASLDPDVGDVIRSFIQDYTYTNKATILLASHNMNEVERLCDKVMMMKKGKIIDHGKCDELISKHGRKNLEEVFLKIAYTNLQNSVVSLNHAEFRNILFDAHRIRSFLAEN